MKSFLKAHWFAILLIGVFCCLYTTPVRDGDFFWHVKTGQWIWEHRSLPNADPFSYTVDDVNPFRPDSHRIQLILKQYWLGDLALYGIWSMAGEGGMVLLRTLSYTGILAFLFLWMRRENKGILPLVFLFLTGTMLLSYPNERPQLFAFIITPALLFLLERLRTTNTIQPRTCFLLPLLTLLWANIHGSFLLANVIIVIYLSDHLLAVLRSKQTVNKRLVLLLLLSILVSLANPNGYQALLEFLTPLPAYIKSIYENMTPYSAAVYFHDLHTTYWLLLLIVIVSILTRLRVMEPTHIMVLVALAALSLTAIRYIPFLFFAAPLLVAYLPQWQSFTATAAVLTLLMIPAITRDHHSLFTFGTHSFFPTGACRFINHTKPLGRLFNYYDWGGYMMLNCPDYKVFTDGRGLVEEISTLHDQLVEQKEWRSILNAYDINLIVVPGMATYANKVLPIIYKLQLDNEWVLVYQDSAALVFARNTPGNGGLITRYGIDKKQISQHITAQYALRGYHP